MNWLNKLLGKSPPREIAYVPQDEADLAPDQLSRKARSQVILRNEGVPINEWLPVIESEAEAQVRSPQEVAHRLLALCAVALKGEGLEPALVQQFIEKFGVAAHLTPDERAFLADRKPKMKDRIRFSWQYEAAVPLFWALHLLDEPLGTPNDICTPADMIEIVRRTPDLTHRGMRPASEILDEADLIYRYHWATRQAELDRAQPPAGLDPGVILERHRGLNWLIGYNDRADWDDVSTDT